MGGSIGLYAHVDADVDARYRIACLWICGNGLVALLVYTSAACAYWGCALAFLDDQGLVTSGPN